MLPKKYRLPLRTQRGQIKQKGRLLSGKFFSLLISKRDDDNLPRFGFIVSKKTHNKASKRNRVRRLLSESVKNFLPQMPNGFDCVFLVKKAIIGKELSEVKKEVQKLFFDEKNHSLFN